MRFAVWIRKFNRPSIKYTRKTPTSYFRDHLSQPAVLCFQLRRKPSFISLEYPFSRSVTPRHRLLERSAISPTTNTNLGAPSTILYNRLLERKPQFTYFPHFQVHSRKYAPVSPRKPISKPSLNANVHALPFFRFFWKGRRRIVLPLTEPRSD